MQARSHALVGAAAWLSAGPVVAAASGAVPLGPGEMLMGAVVTAGAALLPDLDHPRATIARTLGPVTAAVARVVGRAAGGHRGATHSLAAVVLAWVGVTALLRGPAPRPAAAAVVFVCAALAVRAIGPQQARGGAALVTVAAVPALVVGAAALVDAGAAAVGAGGVVRDEAAALGWLPPAVAAGVLLHIVADLLTPGGVPLLWPLAGRQRLALTRTGGRVETAIALAALGLTVWLGGAQLLRLG